MFKFNGYIFSRNDLNKLQSYLLDVVVGFISAFRPDYKDTRHHWKGENLDRQKSLGVSLGALGLGYTVLEGHWQEPGGNFEREHWGDFAGGYDEVEKTFAVLNNSPKQYSTADFIDILRHAAEAYDQYSVLVVAPKSGDVQDSFGSVLLAGHGYYYEASSGFRVPVDQGTFHADMVGDWVEVNGEVVGRGYSRTPGKKGRTFVFNYFDFTEAREHLFNTFSSASYFNRSIKEYGGNPSEYFRSRMGGGYTGSGFSFYANDRSLPSDELLKKQANREWSDLRSSRSREEVQVFQGLRAVLSSGAGMGRILQHLENTDIAFVSAFLTGKNPGARGYGVYEEGETDSMGKAHKAGEMVSRNENKRKNKSLASAIEMAGYGFLKVKGKYEGVEEETFCVINAVEDSEQFAEVMHRLGNSFEQDSVLVCPKGKTPYFFRFDGSKKYADSSGVSPVADAVEDYFTQIKGKKFKFQFSNFSFLELGESDVWTRSSLSPIRGSMVAVSADAYRRKLLSSGLRSHTKSRRGVKSELNFWDFDQWLGANNVYSSLGRGSLLNWMVFQGYSEDAYNEVLASLNRTLAGRVPGSQPITSSSGPRSLAAWSLYEKAQKLKAGGLTYKETVNLLAKEAGVLPKEVKDIIGTSSEWWDGVFDYGLEPLHQDEEAAIQSQRDRAFEKETEQIYSAVVAKQDPIKEQFLSGQINLMGAIDELVASGMDYDEAEEVANSWLP